MLWQVLLSVFIVIYPAKILVFYYRGLKYVVYLQLRPRRFFSVKPGTCESEIFVLFLKFMQGLFLIFWWSTLVVLLWKFRISCDVLFSVVSEYTLKKIVFVGRMFCVETRELKCVALLENVCLVFQTIQFIIWAYEFENGSLFGENRKNRKTEKKTL